MTIGSRAEVFHGNADQTSGGLKKKDLKMKDGRIISKAASKASKKSYKKSAFKVLSIWRRRNPRMVSSTAFPNLVPRRMTSLLSSKKSEY